MSFGNQVTKDDLKGIFDRIPDIPQNTYIRERLMRLLTQKTVQAVPYTYCATYWLTGAANAIAAGALNNIDNVNIQADADFLILNQTYDANTANAARTSGTYVVPNALVLLTDTGSSSQMMDEPAPVPAIFGNGQFPFILPEPKFMAAKSTLQVNVSSVDAAAGFNLRLCFNGVKLFSYN